MNKILALLGGVGAGALAMYYLDPERGRGRRALIRDQAVGLSNDVRQSVSGKAKDLGNRAKGMMHEAKSLTSGQGRATLDQADQAIH